MALAVHGDALAGRASGLEYSESLEATRVVQSIGCPHQWRLSDAGVVVGPRSAAIAGQRDGGGAGIGS
ncbi:MAG: hypothetical protein EOP02_18820 [Proteobacteria bacterium]|nr:MAG: hypothetical protein EOP02_18820 [Pseudomonadota bacterium]